MSPRGAMNGNPSAETIKTERNSWSGSRRSSTPIAWPCTRSPRSRRTFRARLLLPRVASANPPRPIVLRALPCSGPPVSDKSSIESSAAWAAIQFNRACVPKPPPSVAVLLRRTGWRRQAFPPSGLNAAAAAPCCTVGRTAERPCKVGIRETGKPADQRRQPKASSRRRGKAQPG